jgi:hypothetical protein
VRRAHNLTTFICRLSWNLGASNFWNSQDLSRPVMGLLYIYVYMSVYCLTYIHTCIYVFVIVHFFGLISGYIDMKGTIWTTKKIRNNRHRKRFIFPLWRRKVHSLWKKFIFKSDSHKKLCNNLHMQNAQFELLQQAVHSQTPVETWWHTVTYGRRSEGKTGEWSG